MPCVSVDTGTVAGNGPQTANSYNHVDNKMGESFLFWHILCIFILLCTVYVLQKLKTFVLSYTHSWLCHHALCSCCFPLMLTHSNIPGRQLGHYPSLPPGYQNAPVSHGATAPMHPAMQAATQPHSQATQPYQQVRRTLVRRWSFALSSLIYGLFGCARQTLKLGLYIFTLGPFGLFAVADVASLSLVSRGTSSSALPWLP